MNVAQGHNARPFEPTKDLTPMAIEAFLKLSGWKREELHEGISSIWSLDEADASILLPYNKRYRDFQARLSDALEVIADVYSIRSSEALELEIAGARSDILLLRADQTTADGSIPLGEAQSLLGGISGMLMAAACAAIKPSAVIPRRRPDMAREFMAEEVRMGHTLRGSFVMTIYARHNEERVEELPDREGAEGLVPAATEEPRIGSYSRRVMETLSSGLQAAQELLKDEPSISLDEAVQHGASAELVDSLGGMSDHPGLRALDLAFRWSPAQPAPAASIVSRLVIPRPEQERIRSIRDSLRRSPVVEQDDVVGQVIRLERSEGDEYGVAIVEGYLGKTRRRVRVRLAENNYQLAIYAHQARRQVLASGVVTLENRSLWLKGRVSLRILGLP